MANQVIKTTLGNSNGKITLHIYLESDGNTGELVNCVLIDPTVFYPELTTAQDQRANRHILTQVWHSFSWFDALLSFDDLIPTPSWLLARDGENYTDFRYFGGISDRYVEPRDKTSTDRQGRILISTKDFAPLGSIGTMVLEFKRGSS